jgi:hypothetical protein
VYFLVASQTVCLPLLSQKNAQSPALPNIQHPLWLLVGLANGKCRQEMGRR